ncbi:hypothetical protein Tco_0946587, partial [Tanacetum coccineum]
GMDFEGHFQVVLDALDLIPFYQAFLITAEVPAIYMQEFWATVSVQKDLGHTGDITYLIDVNVEYLHQPWRAFATVIKKCLSGKETGMDKIHFLFQIENKDAKKTNKMSYARFTKIIIDYFMSKDQSISRRNKIEKTPKPKYVRKKDDSNTSPKQKPVQATKGTRIKTKAKGDKSNKKKQPAKMPKSKGLDVLSKVPNEQHLKTIGADEGTGTIPGVPDVPIYESKSEKESWGDSEDEDDKNDSDDISDEGDDDNDGNNGNDGDDDNANDDDKQEGDDTNDDNEETDSDRTESDIINIPVLDQSTTEYYEEEEE